MRCKLPYQRKGRGHKLSILDIFRGPGCVCDYLTKSKNTKANELVHKCELLLDERKVLVLEYEGVDLGSEEFVKGASLIVYRIMQPTIVWHLLINADYTTY